MTRLKLSLGSRRHTRWELRRSGYTLMELCVVVALMLLATGIAVPSMFRLLSDARVEGSGDMIRARMADARSMAMEQGKPFRFGFLPGSGQWQIAADDSPLWQNAQEAEPEEADDHVRGVLLQDVVFATEPGTLSENPVSTSGWQLGAVFLADGTGRGAQNPDGTNADSITFYFGLKGFSPMGVRFRGMTGSVRVFDPVLEGDQQP